MEVMEANITKRAGTLNMKNMLNYHNLLLLLLLLPLLLLLVLLLLLIIAVDAKMVWLLPLCLESRSMWVMASGI